MPMFGLYLSDMRVSNFMESDRLVAYSPKKEDLEALLRLEKVETYREHRGEGLEWIKTFRKHGPLEWCNDVRARPPGVHFGFFMVIELRPEFDPRIETIYTLEEYLEKHEQQYRTLLGQAYDAGMIDGSVAVLALPSGENKETDDGNEEDDEGSDQRQGHQDDRGDDGEGQDDAGDREEDRSRAV